MESHGSNNQSDKKQWRAEEAIAGNAEGLEALRDLITFPLYYSTQAHILGLKWPRGLLLYGPPGTGKTSLVRAVVRECGAHLTIISPHSVHRAHAGESESFAGSVFRGIIRCNVGQAISCLIDEIDALCPRRDFRIFAPMKRNTTIRAP